MDWQALSLSLQLAAWTSALLLLIGIAAARALAWSDFPGKPLVEALVTLPLILPPTVLGYYLLVAMGRASPLGVVFESVTGETLVFSFSGLVLASVLYSLPFAVQPMQRAFEAVPHTLREAAWCSGLYGWQTFWRVELPLAWPGVLTGLVLTFAHTLGEFGVVLMVGGNIPGETRTISVAIYDRVQAFDDEGAGRMALLLLITSVLVISLVSMLNRRSSRRRV